jgi:hypothetical protein
MKALFVIQHVNYFRALDPAVRLLHARGHQIVVLHGGAAQKRHSSIKSGRGLESTVNELPGVTVEHRDINRERWHGVLSQGRQLFNASIFMRPEHPSGYRGVGLERNLSPRLRRMVKWPLLRRTVRSRAALKAWRWLEAATPPSPTVLKQLDEIAPDVVLVSPTIWPKDPSEADYLHAARARRIPTAGFVASWDNLTSKGTIHVFPDVLMVWNRALAEEAVHLHDVPPSILRIVGAPYLDRWFGLKASTSAERVCARVGLPPGQPYVLYFCSSPTLITTEVPIVRALADALDRHGRPANVLVRPHPTNATPWDDFTDPRVVVHPRGGDLADTTETWQEFYDMVACASGVIGLNTTAFLEAVVADRPCLTLIDPSHHQAQGATGHFRHLLAGDFLEVAHTVDELAEAVARVAGGIDRKRDGRRAFLVSFLRPSGADVPASVVVADVLESLTPAVRRDPSPRFGCDPIPGLAFDY